MFTALILFSLTTPVEPQKEKEKEFSAEAKKELKKLEGKWKVIKVAGGGKESEFDKEAYFVFKGTELTITSGDRMETCQISAIDTTTDPGCVDLVEKRKGKPDRTVEGVYRIDGDTLQLAHEVPGGGKSRPTSFDKSIDRGLVFTLKRVKE